MTDEGPNLPAAHEDPPGGPPAQLVELLSKLVELETQRVAAAKTEAEVGIKAFKVADADNERQFQFHTNRFEKTHEHRTERWRSRNKKQWVLIGAAVALPLLILGFLFLGSSEQRVQAISVIGHTMSFAAGVGLGYFLGSRPDRGS